MHETLYLKVLILLSRPEFESISPVLRIALQIATLPSLTVRSKLELVSNQVIYYISWNEGGDISVTKICKVFSFITRKKKKDITSIERVQGSNWSEIISTDQLGWVRRAVSWDDCQHLNLSPGKNFISKNNKDIFSLSVLNIPVLYIHTIISLTA